MSDEKRETCDRCGGFGYVDTETCLRCRGDGLGQVADDEACNGCETPAAPITDGYCADCWKEAEGWQRESDARVAMMEEPGPDWSGVDFPYADDITPARELSDLPF